MVYLMLIKDSERTPADELQRNLEIIFYHSKATRNEVIENKRVIGKRLGKIETQITEDVPP